MIAAGATTSFCRETGLIRHTDAKGELGIAGGPGLAYAIGTRRLLFARRL